MVWPLELDGALGTFQSPLRNVIELYVNSASSTQPFVVGVEATLFVLTDAEQLGKGTLSEFGNIAVLFGKTSDHVGTP
jgi:hypothetical protein